MRFLIDNNLSPLLAESLKAAGHDAVHVRDLAMQAAPDLVVLERTQVDERVLVSADTDFGGLLARSHATGPSVLLIRRLAGRRAAEQSAIILANLDQIDAPMLCQGLPLADSGRFCFLLKGGQDREGPLLAEGRLLSGHEVSSERWARGGRRIDRRPAPVAAAE
jgi:predicted nuclease of predicted toxin-antitoxin system